MEKKLRFGDLVRNSGRPQVVTLWTDPRKDRGFTKAIKEDRVLTVLRQPGKRDYGVVGFDRHPQATYIVFPRSLPAGGHVVGMNYQLLAEQEVTDPVSEEDLQPRRRAAKTELKGKFASNIRGVRLRQP
jgi:hypothetical protein